MGTNYYAHIIPTKKRREEIKELIDKDDSFVDIKNAIGETYGSIEFSMGKLYGGVVHLGKRSSGWLFLWNPNIYMNRLGHGETTVIDVGHTTYHWVEDGVEPVKVYELTKEGIKNFIDREDIKIFDEYGEEQDKEWFWDMALHWEEEDGWDGDTYEEWSKEQYPDRKTYNYHTEYCKFLESIGYKMNKYHTDFYSDGLRFASFNEFS